MPRFIGNLAKDYWSRAGGDYGSIELPEGLFRGRAEVIGIEICHHDAPHPV